jgi:hypothetical protein
LRSFGPQLRGPKDDNYLGSRLVDEALIATWPCLSLLYAKFGERM